MEARSHSESAEAGDAVAAPSRYAGRTLVRRLAMGVIPRDLGEAVRFGNLDGERLLRLENEIVALDPSLLTSAERIAVDELPTPGTVHTTHGFVS